MLSTESNQSLQKVINRLENNEQLILGKMRNEDQFCILGLLADESGCGDWITTLTGIGYRISEQNMLSYAALPESVVSYYNLKTRFGGFNIADLDIEIQDKVVQVLGPSVFYASLSLVNDTALDKGYSVSWIKELLINILKSGEAFNKL